MARRQAVAVLGASLLSSLLYSLLAFNPAAAQQPEIRISRTTTMAYLPLMMAEHEKLIEKHAATPASRT